MSVVKIYYAAEDLYIEGLRLPIVRRGAKLSVVDLFTWEEGGPLWADAYCCGNRFSVPLTSLTSLAPDEPPPGLNLTAMEGGIYGAPINYTPS